MGGGEGLRPSKGRGTFKFRPWSPLAWELMVEAIGSKVRMGSNAGQRVTHEDRQEGQSHPRFKAH